MTEASLPRDFQYSSARHQAETAVSGMWLFLASESLFFGPLVLSWIYCRHWSEAGFDFGAQQTDLTLGTINTVLLLTSSLAYSAGAAFMQAGSRRLLVLCLLAAWLLGASFLFLKFGVEWREDFAKGLFPGANFLVAGTLSDGAQLFFVFYFLGTAVHGLHMIVGLVLVAWIASRAREFTSGSHTAVIVVGLYWSFVDMVWVFLYPLIYLIGRGP